MSTVIYHSNDYDGLASAAIMLNGLTVGDWRPTMIGWDYGDPVPQVDPDQDLFLVDISIPELMTHAHLHWIDHHKTAIEQWDRAPFMCEADGCEEPATREFRSVEGGVVWSCDNEDHAPEWANIERHAIRDVEPHRAIPGFRIDGVAACRLCWQFLRAEFPSKQAFIDREVDEPYLIRLLGEYDVWDERDPDARLLQLGLRSKGATFSDIARILRRENFGDILCGELIEDGRPIQDYLRKTGKRKVNDQGYQIDFGGLRFAVLNQNSGNSLSFEGYERMDEVDALMIWRFDARKRPGEQIVVSMYHAPHRKDIDLSEIAKARGGGGHRGACGFQMPNDLATLLMVPCVRRHEDARVKQ